MGALNRTVTIDEHGEYLVTFRDHRIAFTLHAESPEAAYEKARAGLRDLHSLPADAQATAVITKTVYGIVNEQARARAAEKPVIYTIAKTHAIYGSILSHHAMPQRDSEKTMCGMRLDKGSWDWDHISMVPENVKPFVDCRTCARICESRGIELMK